MYSVQPVYTVQSRQNCTKLINQFLVGILSVSDVTSSLYLKNCGLLWSERFISQTRIVPSCEASVGMVSCAGVNLITVSRLTDYCPAQHQASADQRSPQL